MQSEYIYAKDCLTPKHICIKSKMTNDCYSIILLFKRSGGFWCSVDSLSVSWLDKFSAYISHIL